MNSASWNPPIYCWQLPLRPCPSPNPSESIGSTLVTDSCESKSLSSRPDLPDSPSRPNEIDSPEPSLSRSLDSRKTLWSDLPVVLSCARDLPNPLNPLPQSSRSTPSSPSRHNQVTEGTQRTQRTQRTSMIQTYLRVRGLLFR